jgi:hypothetical protein
MRVHAAPAAIDLPNDLLVVQGSELPDTFLKDGDEVRAHQGAGFIVWVGGCDQVRNC